MSGDNTPPDPVTASFLSSPIDVSADSRPEPPKRDLYAADDVPSLLRNLKESKEEEEEEEEEEGTLGPSSEEGTPGSNPEGGTPDPEGGTPDLKDKFKDEDFSPVHYPAPEPEPLFEQEEEEFLAAQPEEEKELVETLRWAEKAGKADGKSTAYVDFLKKHQQFLKSEDVEVGSYEHEEWVKENRPDLDPQQVRQWERGYLKHQIQEEMRTETREQQHKLRELEVRPELEAQRARITDTLVSQLPKEVLEGLEKHGPENQHKLMEELPVETSVSNQAYTETRDQVMAYLNVTRGLETYDPENPAHSAAAAKVVEFGKQMEARPDKEALVQDGKQFVPREKFVTMSPEERESHWTFTPEHILSLFAEDMRLRINAGIEEGRKNLLAEEDRILAKYGLSRPSGQNEGTNVSQNPPTQEPPPPPVKTRPSPTPSEGTPPNTAGDSSFFSKPIAVESTLKMSNRSRL